MAELRHASYCGTRNIYGDMETAAKSRDGETPRGTRFYSCTNDTLGRWQSGNAAGC